MAAGPRPGPRSGPGRGHHSRPHGGAAGLALQASRARAAGQGGAGALAEPRRASGKGIGPCEITASLTGDDRSLVVRTVRGSDRSELWQAVAVRPLHMASSIWQLSAPALALALALQARLSATASQRAYSLTGTPSRPARTDSAATAQRSPRPVRSTILGSSPGSDSSPVPRSPAEPGPLPDPGPPVATCPVP